MTTITDTLTAPTVSAPPQERSLATDITSDFELFLKMLTAQAEYQDPLEPIDSSEYAAQLAQFSAVEQQVRTNELLEQLTGAVNKGQVGELANWIGLEALTTAPIAFDGSPLSLQPNPPTAADAMYLIVSDADGNEVQRQFLTATRDTVTWAGVDDAGQPYPNGDYAFSFEYRGGEDVLSSEDIASYAPVVEARLIEGATYLVLQNGQTVASDDVAGLRQPR